MKFFTSLNHVIIGMVVVSLLAGCSKSAPDVDPFETLRINFPTTVNAGVGEEVKINFAADCGPQTGDFLVFENSSGSLKENVAIKSIGTTSFVFEMPKIPGGKYSVSLARGMAVKLLRSSVTVNIIDRSSKYCSVETKITDDIIYSTCCGSATTSVQQGFDFTADDDYVYFTQVHVKGLNTVGWGPRQKLTSSFSVLPNKMTLKFFSHADNINIEKEGSECYLWLGNYGTRNNEDKYVNPQIISRIKLEKGKTLYNTQTTENYYFGIRGGRQSIDWKNRLIAIHGNSSVKVYKLDDVKAAPVADITLASPITYGGGGSPDPEFTGYVTVKAHDCRNLKAVYSFAYSFSGRGMGWQTYCIADGKAYFFLTLSPTENGYTYESVIEVVDMATGKQLCTKVKQPFSSNMNSFTEYGFTDLSKNYVENEAIVIRDGKLYLTYTCIVTKPDASFSTDPRRPVVFVFDAADPAFNLN